MANIVCNYIGGGFVPCGEKKTFPIFRPEDNGVAATVVSADFMDFVKCTQAVVQHGEKWQKIPYYKKVDVLKKLVDGVDTNQLVFEKLLKTHLGYSQLAAQTEVRESLRSAKYYMECSAEALESGKSPKPYGLNLFFLSSVSPMYYFFLTVFPALLNGNHVVLRPHFQASPIFDGLMQIFSKLGVTEAVLQVLYCEDFSQDIDMVTHPAVRFVYYIGDFKQACRLKELSLQEGTPFFSECGGRNSVILGRNLDFDTSGDEIVRTLFSAHFLSCFRGSRVFIPDSCWDDYLKKLYSHIEDSMGPQTVGYFWSRDQARHFLRAIEKFRGSGSEIKKFPSELAMGASLSVDPCVAEDVSNCEPIQQELVFGPLITLTRYKSVAEAIRFANTSPWGLVNYIFAPDTDKAQAWSEDLNSGLVFINQFATNLHKAPLFRYGRSGQSFAGTYWELFTKPKMVVVADPTEPSEPLEPLTLEITGL